MINQHEVSWSSVTEPIEPGMFKSVITTNFEYINWYHGQQSSSYSFRTYKASTVSILFTFYSSVCSYKLVQWWVVFMWHQVEGV